MDLCIDADLLEKVARLQVQQIGLDQIAQACGISYANLQELIETEDYLLVANRVLGESMQRYTDLNEGWDTLEEIAISNLLDVVKVNRTPDTLLRVAAVANRAQRRGNPRQLDQPLDPSRAGARVIINLQPQFVNRLKEATGNVLAVQDSGTTLGAKRMNMMHPKGVEALLAPVKTNGELLLDGVEVRFENDEEQRLANGVFG